MKTSNGLHSEIIKIPGNVYREGFWNNYRLYIMELYFEQPMIAYEYASNPKGALEKRLKKLRKMLNRGTNWYVEEHYLKSGYRADVVELKQFEADKYTLDLKRQKTYSVHIVSDEYLRYYGLKK